MITLGGSIKIAGPNACEQIRKTGQVKILGGDDAPEFSVGLERGDEDRLSFGYLWIDFSAASRVSILTDRREGNDISEVFNVEIKGDSDESVEFTFTAKQARALAETLDGYLRMIRINEELRHERTVS